LPLRDGAVTRNAVAVLRDGAIEATAVLQPIAWSTARDDGCDTAMPGAPCVFDAGGLRFGMVAGPELPGAQAARAARATGAQILLAPAAAAWRVGARADRRSVLAGQARDAGLPILMTNRVGAQETSVYDGASTVVDAQGGCVQALPAWHETLGIVDLDHGRPRPLRLDLDEDEDADVYAGLIVALRDYVRDSRFSSVLLGLSGGVDSALVLAIAVDALGRDRVRAVMLPSPYTAPMSIEDARSMAGLHGVRYDELPIGPAFDAVLETLDEPGNLPAAGTMEENVQARLRGLFLMALSNRDGGLVLATGNKSELAVGYATLYGDMAGGLALLADVSKTRVYRLARYRNRLGRVIPERVLERAPSAELRPGQTDQDTLPPYEVLDEILEAYVGSDRSAVDVAAAGHDAELVGRILRLVDAAEWKRRQYPPGP
jgi:NAD+ synthase (glutamine-hydrolysing)